MNACGQFTALFGNTSRLEFESAFVKTYTVELGRNSILTTELQCLAARDTDHAVRNKKLLVATDGNKDIQDAEPGVRGRQGAPRATSAGRALQPTPALAKQSKVPATSPTTSLSSCKHAPT